MVDFGFRWTLIGLAAINAVISIFLEDFVMEKGVQNLWKKYGPTAKTKYNEVEAWMNNHQEWPTLSLPQVKRFFSFFSSKSFSPINIVEETIKVIIFVMTTGIYLPHYIVSLFQFCRFVA